VSFSVEERMKTSNPNSCWPIRERIKAHIQATATTMESTGQIPWIEYMKPRGKWRTVNLEALAGELVGMARLELLGVE